MWLSTTRLHQSRKVVLSKWKMADCSLQHGTPHHQARRGTTTSAQTPAQVFDIFIQHLGPPMRSLAYTLRGILKTLPYGPNLERASGNLPKFRSSLVDAIQLFNRSRREALDLVYLSKELSQASSMHVAADFEEVAASCGHFSSSLEDFAETCLKYLDILEDLNLDVNERPRGRSWAWLKFWKYRWSSKNKDFSEYERIAWSKALTPLAIWPSAH